MDSKAKIFTLNLTKEENGLGFLVKKRPIKPYFYISEISKNNPSISASNLKVGDIILRVNDIDYTDINFENGLSLLQNIRIGGEVKIQVQSCDTEIPHTNGKNNSSTKHEHLSNGKERKKSITSFFKPPSIRKFRRKFSSCTRTDSYYTMSESKPKPIEYQQKNDLNDFEEDFIFEKDLNNFNEQNINLRKPNKSIIKTSNHSDNIVHFGDSRSNSTEDNIAYLKHNSIVENINQETITEEVISVSVEHNNSQPKLNGESEKQCDELMQKNFDYTINNAHNTSSKNCDNLLSPTLSSCANNAYPIISMNFIMSQNNSEINCK